MKSSYKFLGLGILAVGLIAAAGIYLKGDGSQVQGAFNPTPATLPSFLTVSQGDYINATQTVSEGKRVPVLAFNLTPGGAIRGEYAFVETMSFNLSSSNLNNNFGNKNSWSLYSLNEDGDYYCSYEIGSVSYSGSVLNISMEEGESVPEGYGWGSDTCYYSTISTASSMEVNGETKFVLTLNVEKSSAVSMASLKIGTRSSGWLWYDDSSYIFMPQEELEEHTYRIVNGSAEVSTKFSSLN